MTLPLNYFEGNVSQLGNIFVVVVVGDGGDDGDGGLLYVY